MNDVTLLIESEPRDYAHGLAAATAAELARLDECTRCGITVTVPRSRFGLVPSLVLCTSVPGRDGCAPKRGVDRLAVDIGRVAVDELAAAWRHGYEAGCDETEAAAALDYGGPPELAAAYARR